MYRRAKARAAAKDLPFDIEPSDIVIPTHCPILGLPLEHHRGRSGAFKASPSLDRIEPELGYVKGNVRVVSQLANAMKGAASPEELLAFADWVYAEYS